MFNVVFSVGGQIRSRHRYGGQNPYISTNSQCYHYSFCPQGGQTPLPSSMGDGRICLPLDPPLRRGEAADSGRQAADCAAEFNQNYVGLQFNEESAEGSESSEATEICYRPLVTVDSSETKHQLLLSSQKILNKGHSL